MGSGPGLILVDEPRELFLYNYLITQHGFTMLFLFIMPIAIGFFGNYWMPTYLGTPELAFPRLNIFAYQLLIVGGSYLILGGLAFELPISCGWTIYPPLSTRSLDSSFAAVDVYIFGIHCLGLSSTISSANFMVTIIDFRHLGIPILQCPLYVWALLVTSALLITALPVLSLGITFLLLDRNANTGLYDSPYGGDPLMFQHLFWFFGHPEVYVIIIPVFGIVSVIISAIARCDVFGRNGMIFAITSIGVIGFTV